MRNKCVQMSLFDSYKDVAASMKGNKPKIFRLLGNTLIGIRLY